MEQEKQSEEALSQETEYKCDYHGHNPVIFFKIALNKSHHHTCAKCGKVQVYDHNWTKVREI